MHIIEKPTYTIMTSDKPFKDFNLLQGYAHMEGNKTGILDGKDKYFTVAYIDGLPTYSWTAVAINVKTLRIVTKLYGHPERRQHIPRSIIKHLPIEYVRLMDRIEPEKLRIVSRSPEMSNWNALWRRIGYEIDFENVYQIGSWKHAASAWKHIYYSGDLTYLDRPKMSKSTYQLMFGSEPQPYL